MAEDDSAAKEQQAEAQRMDSLATIWSLESWIDSLPRQVKIPPGGTKTMTFKVNVPTSATPGEYSAHIIAVTAVVAKPNFGPGGSVVTLPTGAGLKGGTVDLKDLEAVIYPPEGSWPRRALKVVYVVQSNQQ